MYLMAQMWMSLVLAGLLGLAAGYWARRRCQTPPSEDERVDAVRRDALADLTQLKGDLEDSRAWHGRELSEVRQRHAATLAELGKEHQGELLMLRETHLSELQEIREAQASERAALESQLSELVQDKERLSERLDQARSAQLAQDEEIVALRRRVDEAQDQRRTDTAAWMARIRASSETAAANEAQAGARLERALAAHRELEQQLKEAQGQAVTLESQLAEQRQVQAHQAAIDWRAVAAHEAMPPDMQILCERLAQAEEAAIASARHEHEARNALESARVEFESQSDDLREQLAASRRAHANAVRAGEAKEERLSVDIVELRAEIERLRRERAEASRRAVALHRPSRLALLDVSDVERLVTDSGTGRPPMPALLEGAQPDDLKLVDGIDNSIENWMHGMGIFFYWQIASWSPEEAAWVAHHLPADKSLVWRSNWMGQCARLAAREGLAA